ncbi:hypothetical protein H4R35_002175 [Dimargaris xerosporica]|nr:hypothetical protein H4R35_002175 [Dimargaris xerosporica]
MSASHPDPLAQQVEVDEGIDLSADVVETPLKTLAEPADTAPEEHSATDATPSMDNLANDVDSAESPAPADLASGNQPTNLAPGTETDDASLVAPSDEVQEIPEAAPTADTLSVVEPLDTDEVAPMASALEVAATPSQDQPEPASDAPADPITPVQLEGAVADATDALSEELPPELPTTVVEPEDTPAPAVSELDEAGDSESPAEAPVEQPAADTAPVAEHAPISTEATEVVEEPMPESAVLSDITSNEDPSPPLDTGISVNQDAPTATPQPVADVSEAAPVDSSVVVDDVAVEAAPTPDVPELSPADGNPPHLEPAQPTGAAVETEVVAVSDGPMTLEPSPTAEVSAEHPSEAVAAEPGDGEVTQSAAAEDTQALKDDTVSADVLVVAESEEATPAPDSNQVTDIPAVEPEAALTEVTDDEANTAMVSVLEASADAEVQPEAQALSTAVEERSELPVEGEVLVIDASDQSVPAEPEAEIATDPGTPSAVQQTETAVEAESSPALPEVIDECSEQPEPVITETPETTELMDEAVAEPSVSETPVGVTEEQTTGEVPAALDAIVPEAPVQAMDMIETGTDATSAGEITQESALKLPAADVTEVAAVAAPLVKSESTPLPDDVPEDVVTADEISEALPSDASADQAPRTHEDDAVVSEAQPQPAAAELAPSADPEPIVEQTDTQTVQTAIVVANMPEAIVKVSEAAAENEPMVAGVDDQKAPEVADPSLDAPESTEHVVAPTLAEAERTPVEPISEASEPTGREVEPVVNPPEDGTVEVEAVVASGDDLVPIPAAETVALAKPETHQGDETSLASEHNEGEGRIASDDAAIETNAPDAAPADEPLASVEDDTPASIAPCEPSEGAAAEQPLDTSEAAAESAEAPVASVEDDAPVFVATRESAEELVNAVEQSVSTDEQPLGASEAVVQPAEEVAEPEATPEGADVGPDPCEAVTQLDEATNVSSALAEVEYPGTPTGDADDVTSSTVVLEEPTKVEAEVAQSLASTVEKTGSAVQETSEDVPALEPSSPEAVTEAQPTLDAADPQVEIEASTLDIAVNNDAPEAEPADGQDQGIEAPTQSDDCPPAAISEPASTDNELAVTQPADAVEIEALADEPAFAGEMAEGALVASADPVNAAVEEPATVESVTDNVGTIAQSDATLDSEPAPIEESVNDLEAPMQEELAPNDQVPEPELALAAPEEIAAVVETEAGIVEGEAPTGVIEEDTPAGADEAVVADTAAPEPVQDDGDATEEPAPMAVETAEASIDDADVPTAELEAPVPLSDEMACHEAEVVQIPETIAQAPTDADAVVEKAVAQEEVSPPVPSEFVEQDACANVDTEDLEPSAVAATEIPCADAMESAETDGSPATDPSLALDHVEATEGPAAATEACQAEALPDEGEAATTEAPEPEVTADTAVLDAETATDGSAETVKTGDELAAVEDQFSDPELVEPSAALLPDTLSEPITAPESVAPTEEPAVNVEPTMAADETQRVAEDLRATAPENADEGSVTNPPEAEVESGASAAETSALSATEEIPVPETTDGTDTEALPSEVAVEPTDVANAEQTSETPAESTVDDAPVEPQVSPDLTNDPPVVAVEGDGLVLCSAAEESTTQANEVTSDALVPESLDPVALVVDAEPAHTEALTDTPTVAEPDPEERETDPVEDETADLAQADTEDPSSPVIPEVNLPEDALVDDAVKDCDLPVSVSASPAEGTDEAVSEETEQAIDAANDDAAVTEETADQPEIFVSETTEAAPVDSMSAESEEVTRDVEAETTLADPASLDEPQTVNQDSVTSDVANADDSESAANAIQVVSEPAAEQPTVPDQAETPAEVTTVEAESAVDAAEVDDITPPAISVDAVDAAAVVPEVDAEADAATSQAEVTLDQPAPVALDSTECTKTPATTEADKTSAEVVAVEVAADEFADGPASERAVGLVENAEGNGDMAPVDRSTGDVGQPVAEEEIKASGQKTPVPETAEDSSPVIEEAETEPEQPNDTLNIAEPEARPDSVTAAVDESMVDHDPEPALEASPEPVDAGQSKVDSDPSPTVDEPVAVESTEVEVASDGVLPMASASEAPEADCLATETEPKDGSEHPVVEDATSVACDRVTAEQPTSDAPQITEVGAEPSTESGPELVAPVIADAQVPDGMAPGSEESQAAAVELDQSAESEATIMGETQEQEPADDSADAVVATEEAISQPAVPETDEVIPEPVANEQTEAFVKANMEQSDDLSESVLELPVNSDRAVTKTADAVAESHSAEPVTPGNGVSGSEPVAAEPETLMDDATEQRISIEAQPEPATAEPEAPAEPELPEDQVKAPAEVGAAVIDDAESSSPVEPPSETPDATTTALDTTDAVVDEQTSPEAQPEPAALEAEAEVPPMLVEIPPVADPDAGETTRAVELIEQPAEEVQDDTDAQLVQAPMVASEQADEAVPVTETPTPPNEVPEITTDDAELIAQPVSDGTTESPNAPGADPAETTSVAAADERSGTVELEPVATEPEPQVEDEAEEATDAGPEPKTEVTAPPAEIPTVASTEPTVIDDPLDVQSAADEEPMEPEATCVDTTEANAPPTETIEPTAADTEAYAGHAQTDEAVLDATPTESSENPTAALAEIPTAEVVPVPTADALDAAAVVAELEPELADDQAEESVTNATPVEAMERSAAIVTETPGPEPEAAGEPVAVDQATDEVPQPGELAAEALEAPTATEADPIDTPLSEPAAALDKEATAVEAPASDDGMPQSTVEAEAKADADVEPATALAVEPEVDVLPDQEPVADVAEPSTSTVDANEAVVDDKTAAGSGEVTPEAPASDESPEEPVEPSAEISADNERTEPLDQDTGAGAAPVVPISIEELAIPAVADGDVVVREAPPTSEETSPSEQATDEVTETVDTTDDAPLVDAPVEESSPVESEAVVLSEQVQVVAADAPEEAAEAEAVECPEPLEVAEAPVAIEVPATPNDASLELTAEPAERSEDAPISTMAAPETSDNAREAADAGAAEPTEAPAATEDLNEQVTNAVEGDVASIHSIPAAEDDVDSIIDEPAHNNALPDSSTSTCDVADAPEAEVMVVSPTSDILDSGSAKAVEAVVDNGPTGDRHLSETESAVYESATEALATDSAIADVTKPQDETLMEESKPEPKPKRVHRSMWRRLKSWFVYTPE